MPSIASSHAIQPEIVQGEFEPVQSKAEAIDTDPFSSQLATQSMHSKHDDSQAANPAIQHLGLDPLDPLIEDESSEFSIIDRSIIQSICQMAGSRATTLMASLIQAYQEDAPLYYEAIKAAIEADDAEALRKAAHTLRSSSANLGGLMLANACKQLEDLARTGTTAGSPAQWSALQQYYSSFLAALADLAIELLETDT
jgi:HPt (histidine-containing phosphotransfer) domain-containing protein